MPIETVCTGCQRTLRVADEYAGRKARCPQCHTVYQVPDPRRPGEVGKSNESAASDPPSSPPNRFHPVANAIPPAGPLASGDPNLNADVRWRVRLEDGREYGPITRSELDGWYGQGRLSPRSAVQQEGHGTWLPAATLYPVLSRSPQVPEPQERSRPVRATPSFVPQPGSPFPNPYGPSPAMPATPNTFTPILPANSGVMVLILSLLSFLFPCCILEIVAVSIALSDYRQIQAGRMSSENGILLAIGGILSGVRLAGIVLVVLVALIVTIAGGK